MAVKIDTEYYSRTYPFVSGLEQMGMYAQLVNGKVNIGPAALVNQDIIQIAKENRDAIYNELLKLGLTAAEDKAETFQCLPLANRYVDPNHDLEAAYDEYVIAYELAAELYNAGNVNPFWNGDENNIPPIPFYWVWDCKLGDGGDSGTYRYKYYCMFRDTDNKDSIVIEQKLRDMLKARQLERGY